MKNLAGEGEARVQVKGKQGTEGRLVRRWRGSLGTGVGEARIQVVEKLACSWRGG